MLEQVHKPIEVTMEVFDTGELKTQTIEFREPGGLYVLNMPRLINSGSLEVVKASNAIIGSTSKLDYSANA